MNIENLEKDRIEKIESLLTYKIDEEIKLLNNMIAKGSYSDEEKILLAKTLDYVLAQDYGETLLYKYYVAHPIRITSLVLDWLDSIGENHFDLVRASLIHNALEKNISSPEELEKTYGLWSRHTIEVLTVDREAQKLPGWAPQYYGNILNLDKYGQMLKVFDKFDNIYALCLNPDDQVRKTYLEEIEEYIQPILDKYAPDLSDYFAELITSTKALGHKSIESYLEEFNNGK